MGPTVSRPQATSIPMAMPRPALSISPMSPGSPPATAPEDPATSRTRPPATTHPARHELTINADFRAITDLTAHWRARYRAVPGAQPVIDGHVREWCEQILVEVVLAARNSGWNPEQFDALLSPTSLTAALLPRHLLHAMLQKRLGQKLGAPRGDAGGSSPDSTARDLPPGRAPAELRGRTGRSQEGRRAGSSHPIIGARQGGPEL
jgi:hypothetical protein